MNILTHMHTYMPLSYRELNWTTNLSFTIDTDDSTASLVRSSHKNSVTANTIHIDTSGSFNVVQMDITVFGDEVDHIVFCTHLRHMQFSLAIDIEKENSDTMNEKHTCIATGKSFCASTGKNTSTAFFWNGWFPAGGWPTSIMCNYWEQIWQIIEPSLSPHLYMIFMIFNREIRNIKSYSSFFFQY